MKGTKLVHLAFIRGIAGRPTDKAACRYSTLAFRLKWPPYTLRLGGSELFKASLPSNISLFYGMYTHLYFAKFTCVNSWWYLARAHTFK